MTDTPAPITTLEQAAARIQQLERAHNIRVGSDGVAIPHKPEPMVPHIYIVTEAHTVQLPNGFVYPATLGYVPWAASMARSQAKAGRAPRYQQPNKVLLVEHPTLKAGETASPEELAALVAAAKPAR